MEKEKERLSQFSTMTWVSVPKILLILDFYRLSGCSLSEIDIIATRNEFLQMPSWCCFIIREVNHWTELQNYQEIYSLSQMEDTKMLSMHNLLMFLDLSLLLFHNCSWGLGLKPQCYTLLVTLIMPKKVPVFLPFRYSGHTMCFSRPITQTGTEQPVYWFRTVHVSTP